MTKKSIRDMSALERLHYSLEGRVFRAMLLGSTILGFVTLLVGLSLYSIALAGQYIGESFGLARSTALVVNQIVDTEVLSEEVMSVYRGLSDAQRADPDSDGYLALYEDVENDEGYDYLLTVLREFRDASGVFDLYLGVYDRESCALVYLADPEEDPEYACPPGYWEELKPSELEKFLTWDGTGRLYDVSRTERYGWMCTAGFPIRSGDGEIVCFMLADVTMDGLVVGMRRFALQFAVAVLFVELAFGFLLLRHMKKTMVTPINAIAEAARSYAADKREGSRSTEHFSTLHIQTGDQIENLSIIMADMERDLTEYEENLTKITSEKERIATELSLATRIQADMLPNIFPAFPEREEFDIYASMDPAKEVGGDFYDYFFVDDTHLGMVIADVSGKGIPAALFMMVSKTVLQQYAMQGLSPREVLEAANRTICANNREKMFVTVWLGVLDLETGTLVAANAGHEYPMIGRAGEGFSMLRDKHGFVVGGLPISRYKEYELQLEPGDAIFLYTDGVAEATNAAQELFETDRMLASLNRGSDAEPEELLRRMRADVDAFVGSAPQFDDLTMLCLRYNGPKRSDNALKGNGP